MEKTKYINTCKEKKKTKFTHYLDTATGWNPTLNHPDSYLEVKYLGKCNYDGDMFATTTRAGVIEIYKGVKGDEFK